MTVKEMMDVLSQLDPNKEVTVWNCEYDCTDPISEIEVNQDGEVVLY